jgi:Flp pilus assembly protein TadD
VASRKRPRSPALAFALGGLYQRQGQGERAIALVRQVLRRNPESAEALNFVGYALTEHGTELGEARRLLERARKLRPHSGEIADSLGWLYLKLNRVDDAERLLTRADRLTPDDPEILGHLGQLYVRKENRPRAVELYRRALAHKPEEKLRHALEEQLLLLETGRVGSR